MDAALATAPRVNAAGVEAAGAVRHRALRPLRGGPLAAEIGLRSAVASAALEGHRYELDEVRAGTVTDPVVQGALRVSAALRRAGRDLAGRRRGRRWPGCTSLAARGCAGVDDDALGRPLATASVSARLDRSCDRGRRPGRGRAGAAARGGGARRAAGAAARSPDRAGVVARAAARLTLIADGLDPRGLIAPELGHLAREPEYVGCANAFSTGTPDGVRSWLRHCATAVEIGAAELTALAEGG